jgi:transposase
MATAGVMMRGTDETSGSLFSYVDLDERIPPRHPLRKIRQVVNDALASLDGEFEALYTDFGRPSIPPERLIRASLLQILFSVRSERQLMEQMDYNLMFRWFADLGIDDPVWGEGCPEICPVGAVEEVVSGRRRIWSGRAHFDDRTEHKHHSRRQLLEVHCDGGHQSLDFHVFEPSADGSGKSVERLCGAVRAFDLPSVAGVDRVVVFTPCRAFAPGAQDGRLVGDDMHPAGWRALGQALRLERAARAVAPVSAIPSAGFRAVAGGKPLLRRT